MGTRTRQARGPQETPHGGADRVWRWGGRRTRRGPSSRSRWSATCWHTCRRVDDRLGRPRSGRGLPFLCCFSLNASHHLAGGNRLLQSKLERAQSFRSLWKPARRPIFRSHASKAFVALASSAKIRLRSRPSMSSPLAISMLAISRIVSWPVIRCRAWTSSLPPKPEWCG